MKKVTIKFVIEVEDETDPGVVLHIAQRSLDDAADGGLLCQWGDWGVGEAELVEPEDAP